MTEEISEEEKAKLTPEERQKLEERQALKEAIEKKPKKKLIEPIVGCSRPPMTE